MGKEHDNKIKALLAKVDEQQTGLGTKPKTTLVTNGVFKSNDIEGGFFNLNTVKDPDVLLNALAIMLARETAFDEAAKMLKVKDATFKWDGYTVAQWAGDFKSRLDAISYDARKKQLDATKAKLKDLRSEDLRTGDALEELEKLI